MIKVDLFEEIPCYKQEDLMLHEIIRKEDLMDVFTFPMNDSQAMQMLQTFQTLYKQHKQLTLGIYNQKQLVGILQLKKLTQDTYEIGYHIQKKYRNQGYMQKALQLLLQHINIQLYARVQQENVVSKHILEKCGFLQEFNKNGVYMYRK